MVLFLKTLFFSFLKSSRKKVMVIIFYFIVIYQLNINMRPKRHKDIDFPSLCKKNENPIYFIYILVKWSKIIIGKKIEKKIQMTMVFLVAC